MTTLISFTDAACTYIQKTIKKNNGLGLRLTVKKTGCSAYSYEPTIIEKVNLKDIVIEPAQDVKIFIDSDWLHLLKGLHIDYVEEKKSGLKQKRLTFTNPNESSRCGCGESFNIE